MAHEQNPEVGAKTLLRGLALHFYKSWSNF